MPQADTGSATLLRQEVDQLQGILAAPDATCVADPEIRLRLDRIGDLFLDMTGASGPTAPLPPSSGAR